MFINMTTRKCEIMYMAHILLDSAILNQKGKRLIILKYFSIDYPFFQAYFYTFISSSNLVFSTLGFSWILWHEWFIIHLFPPQAYVSASLALLFPSTFHIQNFLFLPTAFPFYSFCSFRFIPFQNPLWFFQMIFRKEQR